MPDEPKKYTEYWKGRELNKHPLSWGFDDDVIDRALKKIIQTQDSMDYSNGYLVSNQNYGIAKASSTYIDDGKHHDFFYYSPNGYSIIPSFEEEVKWCSKIAAIWAFLTFICTSVLLPLVCYILYFLALIPLELIAILGDYFRWVRKGFI